MLYLLVWLGWELAILLQVASPMKAVLWELGFYALNLQECAPRIFNLLGLGFLLVTGSFLFILFKVARSLFDRLLPAGK